MAFLIIYLFPQLTRDLRKLVILNISVKIFSHEKNINDI